MITDALALAKKKPVRPLRIVMMDDVPNVLEIIEFMFRSFYKDATILTFTDAKLACQELMREAPDLFITDE
jgi:CheY-like chemotaxis protein